MPKKRVVTAAKPMKFATTFGTEHFMERQDHAEEREAKRWIETRLNNYRALAAKYDIVAHAEIADHLANLKGTDLMAMKPEHVYVWNFTYDTVAIVAGVRRLP